PSSAWKALASTVITEFFLTRGCVSPPLNHYVKLTLSERLQAAKMRQALVVRLPFGMRGKHVITVLEKTLGPTSSRVSGYASLSACFEADTGLRFRMTMQVATT